MFDGEKYQSRDKSWGKSLNDESFFDGLCYFFDPNSTTATTMTSVNQRRLATLVSIIEQLERLSEFMKQQREYRFYASSLLFVYEALLDVDEVSAERAAPRVVMIDMAHVFPYRDDDGVGDNGYTVALENLLRYFRRLLLLWTPIV